MADVTLLDRLNQWALEQPEKTIYSFADDSGSVVASLSYKDFDEETANLARLMLASPSSHAKGMGLKKNDKLVLVYPPGLDFIVAFVACLRAGVVAVPVYPPDPRKLKKDIVMFTTVWSNSGAKTALTCANYNHVKKILDIKQKMTFSESYPWPELKWIETDRLGKNKAAPNTVNLPVPDLNDLAFLQYTSGSTSDPKGVMVSHGNLSHNLSIISEALNARNNSVVVSWLPQYHDMGLIGAYLGILYTGGSGVYISPFSFIKNPNLWIQLISKYKATHLQAPNFAYALCARKFVPSPNLDLSSVCHMINGAEPIDGAAIDNFYATFKPYGLRQGVVRPTYGLAEHTVYVCDSAPELTRIKVIKSVLETEDKFEFATSSTPAQDIKEMVGCGSPEVDVRVVNVDLRVAQPEGLVGEIWVSSKSTTQGYYNMPDLTKEMFHATLANAPDVEYVRTGDLGVFYKEQLFICGRLKDLIIIRGRNHYPQDIEKTIEGFDAIRPGCSAAFSALLSDDEVLCAMAEVRPEATVSLDQLATSIRQAVASEHGVTLEGFVFLNARAIPKTTSGKISRKRCKVAFLTKSLPELHRSITQVDQSLENDQPNNSQRPLKRDFPPLKSVPSAEVLGFLRHEIAHLVNVREDEVLNTTTLQGLGMDSMGLTQLQGIIANQYGVHAPEEILYAEQTTIQGLYDALKSAPLSPSQSPNIGGDNQTSFLEDPPTPPRPRMCCGCIRIR
ncbi:fatty-acid-CoA ligase [Thraustotheca clavata]|uniref:Fatty-acid-CoA ligase n=1 Tax=Thraustotheca clavata TaxID=74557 RepID=A0A1V9ZKA6_9STRA|nr:fatty-acid-CoA ligase [Thraustotheca clavata]